MQVDQVVQSDGTARKIDPFAQVKQNFGSNIEKK